MELTKIIEKNPMISYGVAKTLLANATIMQHGVSATETIPVAISRITNTLARVMSSNENIHRVYRKSEFEVIDEEAAMEDGYSADSSTVNLAALLECYNKSLESDNLPRIELSLTPNKHEINNSDLSRSSILHLVEIVAKITNNLCGRDDKLTNDMIDRIYSEFTNGISDSYIQSLLPEIKSSVKAVVADKITKGRLSNITAKKIQAAIFLAESFKDKNPKQMHSELLTHLQKHNNDLAVADREDIAAIYLETKQV